MIATRLLPIGANDVLFPPILDFALGDLSQHGIRRPQQGILQQIAGSAKIPVIDVGTARRISAGEIRIAPGIVGITEDGVAFKGGDEASFDAIVLATGYRPNYRSYLDLGGDPAARPEATNGQDHALRLFFVGYRNAVTGLLREIGKEARHVADHIWRRRNGLHAA